MDNSETTLHHHVERQDLDDSRSLERIEGGYFVYLRAGYATRLREFAMTIGRSPYIAEKIVREKATALFDHLHVKLDAPTSINIETRLEDLIRIHADVLPIRHNAPFSKDTAGDGEPVRSGLGNAGEIFHLEPVDQTAAKVTSFPTRA